MNCWRERRKSEKKTLRGIKTNDEIEEWIGILYQGFLKIFNSILGHLFSQKLNSDSNNSCKLHMSHAPNQKKNFFYSKESSLHSNHHAWTTAAATTAKCHWNVSWNKISGASMHFSVIHSLLFTSPIQRMFHMRVKISQVFYACYVVLLLLSLAQNFYFYAFLLVFILFRIHNLLSHSWCAHIFLLWQHPIIVFRVISSYNFLDGNRIPKQKRERFPGFSLISQHNTITYESTWDGRGKLTRLIQWKMCWIIKGNHQTNGCFSFFPRFRSVSILRGAANGIFLHP